jgi:hypothetical protein
MRQEFVKDHPLIMPHGQPVSLEVRVVVGNSGIL